MARAEGLPKTLKMTEAAKLEIMRDGKKTGMVGLAVGAELQVLELGEEWVKVKYRSVEGRVPVGKTDLVARMTEIAAKAEAAEAAAMEAEIKAQAEGKAPPAKAKAKPAALRSEPSEMERILAGKLVRLSGSSLKPVREPELEGVKFYAVYFSASWCGPCREFTPGFVDAYRELRKNYPEFEAVFVSNDRSAADMLAYMRGDKMAWAAVRFDAVGGLDEINRYAGNGIPCLVLVDANGKVLSDSFRKGNYVGPNTVLNDTTKLLGEYRRKNPRVKS
jgi:nucleoredoxin